MPWCGLYLAVDLRQALVIALSPCDVVVFVVKPSALQSELLTSTTGYVLVICVMCSFVQAGEEWRESWGTFVLYCVT
jgi:hypothetical protein